MFTGFDGVPGLDAPPGRRSFLTTFPCEPFTEERDEPHPPSISPQSAAQHISAVLSVREGLGNFISDAKILNRGVRCN